MTRHEDLTTTGPQPIISEEEFHQLKRLTEQTAKAQERMAGDAEYVFDNEGAARQYESRRDELDTFARELQARGVTEDDIELRAALIANPNYREPASLGFVVIDDEDISQSLHQELARREDFGIDR